MRSIKFRAWDKQDEQWIDDWGDIFIDYEGTVYLIEERTWAYQSYMHKENITEEVEVVLSTGLKDKNGKEIYEQDILEVESFEGSKSVVRVVFDDGCFCHIGHLGDLRTYPLRDFLFNGSKVQVIGNIFQHPHLLEESE